MQGQYFDGDDYNHLRDFQRLSRQIQKIYDVMRDSAWRSLRDIAEITGFSEASISAQLRNLRKKRFGSHKVDKERQPEGHYLYRVVPTDSQSAQQPFAVA